MKLFHSLAYSLAHVAKAARRNKERNARLAMYQARKEYYQARTEAYKKGAKSR